MAFCALFILDFSEFSEKFTYCRLWSVNIICDNLDTGINRTEHKVESKWDSNNHTWASYLVGYVINRLILLVQNSNKKYSFLILSASIVTIAQPLGSIFSGFLTEPLGRKKALICVNVPYAIGWIMLYYANSLTVINIAFALLGLGIGLMEAPIFTYIGEIW